MTAGYALPPAPRVAPDWRLVLGAAFAAAIILPALAVPFWTPSAGSAGPSLAEPGGAYWLGTDAAGRDLVPLLSSAMLASLLFAAFASLFTLLLALPVAAFFALWLDREGAATRLLGLPAPAFAVGIVVAAIGAPGHLAVILGIVLPGLAATVPALARDIRELWGRDYVTSARIAGLGTLAAAQRHVLPGLLPRLLAIGLELLAVATIIEMTLTFAGLGAPPSGASLGLMLRDGQQFLSLRPLLVVAPGLVALAVAAALFLLAGGLRGDRR